MIHSMLWRHAQLLAMCVERCELPGLQDVPKCSPSILGLSLLCRF